MKCLLGLGHQLNADANVSRYVCTFRKIWTPHRSTGTNLKTVIAYALNLKFISNRRHHLDLDRVTNAEI